MSLAKVIRLKCLDCCGGSVSEVSLCTVKGCPLFEYRFGTDPFRKSRVLSESHKQALIAGRIARAGKGQASQNPSIRGNE